MATTGYVVLRDPSQLENCRSLYPDATEQLEELETPEKALSLEEQIGPLLPLLPKRERDLIALHYIQKKKQADLAIVFGITQAAISYRIARGIHRIKFLLSIPRVTEEELRRDLPDALMDVDGVLDPNDVDIMVEMWRTTCQSDVSKILGLSQGLVRHHFFRSVKRLELRAADDLRFEPYAKIFTMLSNKNFSVLKFVSLPQWSGRGGDECI